MKKALKPLLLLLAAVLTSISAGGQERWNTLSIMEENKLTSHVNVIPYSDEAAIETLDYYGSSYCKSLNGTWKIKYVERPADIPQNFYSKKYNIDEWGKIKVPGNLELQGYGIPVYVNTINEFPANPPYVPKDYNPVGCYATDFEVPAEWKGRRVVLKFGAVKAAMELYINGKYVGYSEDSKTAAEFDITKYVTQGSNRLAMAVYRFCNGSYLECQDMWRMSGITRDVVLYSTPTAYIADYSVEAKVVNNTSGAFSLEVVTAKANGCTVEYELYDGGRKVLDGAAKVSSNGKAMVPAATIMKVKRWSDVAPNLYTLVLRLKDKKGNTLEVTGSKVGFRTLELKDGQLMINGTPIVIKGVNRHEHSAFGGQYVTREEMETDIKLMQAAGINAVRTSHYPNDEYWYELCDKYGILVMDEANNEAHGQGYRAESLAKRPEWAEAIWYRINNMYMRDKNHVCIFAWSLGNETGAGVCFDQAYKRLKDLDQTRPVCLERAENGKSTDITTVMYPSISYLSQYVREQSRKEASDRRPYIIAEYCHAMGNSLGALKDYWDTISRYPVLQGGFIWDWIDQSFVMSGNKRVTSPGQAKNMKGVWYALGGDLGELPGIKDDDAFCANGLIRSDRVPHEHYYEAAAVFKKLKTKNEKPTFGNLPTRTTGVVKVGRNAQGLTISGDDFSIVIDTTNGYVVDYTYKGKPMICAPIRYNFWRPPTLNDRVDANGVKAWQGLDSLECKMIHSKLPANGKYTASQCGSAVRVSFDMRLLSYDGGYILVKEVFDIDGSGLMNISYLVSANGSLQTLPKMGIQMGLDNSMATTEWFGNSYESYPDRRTARNIGRHSKKTAQVLGEMHPVPQESGNREAWWVKFGGKENSLAVCGSKKEGLNFSVREYTDDVMYKARRIKDLKPADYYIVNIDYKQAGLGTATCGQEVLDDYVILGDSTYKYHFTLVPQDKDNQDVSGYCDCFAENGDMVFPADMVRKMKSPIVRLRATEAPDSKYKNGFPRNLYNNRQAIVSSWGREWSGFLGKGEVVFTATLDSLRTVNKVTLGSCTAAGEWVLPPTEVFVEYSADGKQWSEPVKSEANTKYDEQNESKRIKYAATLKGVKAGQLRVTVKCRAALPEWHDYKGQDAWLMVDEIMVE